MTHDQAEALGRRWREAGGVARDGALCWWEHPISGAIHSSQYRIVSVGDDLLPLRVVSARREDHELSVWGLAGQPGAAGGFIVDLRDPATRGAALEVVRERWGIKRLWVEFQVDNAMWSVGDWSLGWACLEGETPPPDIAADSEAELLVRALEAAPKVTP